MRIMIEFVIGMLLGYSIAMIFLFANRGEWQDMHGWINAAMLVAFILLGNKL